MTLVVATAVFGPIALLFARLVRMAHADAARTIRTVTTSPWNDIEAIPARRSRVLAVLTLEDEMLVELHLEPSRTGEPADSVHLVGSSSIAAIVTLNRWRDARCAVMVHELCGRYLLHTAQSRLAWRASPVSGRAPTA